MALPDAPLPLPSGSKPLTKPILVGGTLTSGWVVVPSCFLLAAGFMVLNGIVRKEWPLVTIALSAMPVLGGITLLAALVQLARRRWLEVTLDGFVLTRRDGSRVVYNDQQIVALAQQTIPNRLGSVKRRVVLEVQNNERLQRIECFYVLKDGEVDSLNPLVDRNMRALIQRTQAALAQGAGLGGDGWYYDHKGLHIQRGPVIGVYPIEQLTYVAWFNDQIQIYRDQEFRPFFSIPQGSRNADVLAHLLWGQMQTRPGLNDPIHTHPLGRWMYTFKNRDAFIGSIISILFICGFVLSNFSLRNRLGTEFFLLLPLCLLGATLGLWLIWRGWTMQLDYHQFGLCQPNRQRLLPFEQIEAMTWSTDCTSIRFEPLPGDASQQINYQVNFPLFHLNLIVIRDYIASLIAKRWWQRLSERQSVRWTKRLVFHSEELEYIPQKTLLGSKDPQRVPYQQLSFYLFVDRIDLYVQGQSKVAMQQTTEARNFYPGLMVLYGIYSTLQQLGSEQAASNSLFTSRELLTSDERIRGA
ncbi:MAG: hypothetical protein SNJ75_04415 [Gemmataceae bacterium]